MQGAISETQNKFINPSNLDRFKGKHLNVLDICFGLGYNSALLFRQTMNQSIDLNWFGLEIDKRPLLYALKKKPIRDQWDHKVITIFESFLTKNSFEDDLLKCKFLWGDAREKIREIPHKRMFDLIFLDGFSPMKCPEIWSIEFLSEIVSRLNKNGSVITYCSSAAIRLTLKNLGLRIYNIKPLKKDNRNWSSGTFATYDKDLNQFEKNNFIEELSIMEKEHLKTKASIPYRDPFGNRLSSEIITQRIKEQNLSKLPEASTWRKRWGMTK